MAQHVTSQDQMHQLVDEHGNPRVHGTHEGTAPTGTVAHDAMKKGHEHQHEGHGQQQLHRSGSSSSSSSEDDGEGGRRKKKGVTEKIKETLTGGTHDDKKEIGDQQQIAQTTAAAPENEGEDKKGMMDKIKDKIPGMH